MIIRICFNAYLFQLSYPEFYVLSFLRLHLHKCMISWNHSGLKLMYLLLKDSKQLYVLIPLLIACVSRTIYLHDKISDLFHIRYRFDVYHILYPLAKAIGLPLTKNQKKWIWINRRNAMYTIFYSYAGFKDPKIDLQLIRNALDAWGWFWVAVEAVFMFTITLVIVTVLRQWLYVSICLGANVFLLVFLLYQGFICKRNALREVDAIVADTTRNKEIRNYFQNL